MSDKDKDDKHTKDAREPARMCPALLEQCPHRCTPEQVRECEELRYGA